jgi:hypothetical protein
MHHAMRVLIGLCLKALFSFCLKVVSGVGSLIDVKGVNYQCSYGKHSA